MSDLLLALPLAYLTIGVVIAATIDRRELRAVLGWPVVAIVAAVGAYVAWAAADEVS